ncbi:MAG: beta-lactamase family protein [Desulfobacterales bacterium]|nr:beta-lactamase family protein [Desulfobacterales bacterium]
MSEQNPSTAAELNLMQSFPPGPEHRVTLANWSEGPPVRWSFMHACELVPGCEAHRGYGPVYDFPVDEQDINDIRFESVSGEMITFGEMLGRSYADSLLVLHHGRIISEQYFNGMKPHYRHLMQSVSKSLVASLAGIFIEKKELDPNEVVSHYLTEFKGSAYEDATIQQVLDMTVAVEYTEDYGNPDSHVTIHETAAGWRARKAEHSHVPESQYLFFPELKHRADMVHGEKFHYVSANTDVLAWILERITGTRFTTLFEQEIWQHMGAQENAAMLVDAWGGAAASGGFNITLRDLGLFGLMMLNKGFHNGQQIIPEAFIHDTRSNGDITAWLKSEDEFVKFFPKGSYRNQFWITGNNHDAFFCSGIHGQHVYMDPTADMVIVKFSSQPAALVMSMVENALLGFDALSKSLS